MEDKICDWYDYSCGFEYLTDEIKTVLISAFDSVLSAFAGIFESIPVPDFVAKIPTYDMPPYFLYMADIFQIYNGIQIVMAGYLIRFIIRRLPFIG